MVTCFSLSELSDVKERVGLVLWYVAKRFQIVFLYLSCLPPGRHSSARSESNRRSKRVVEVELPRRRGSGPSSRTGSGFTHNLYLLLS